MNRYCVKCKKKLNKSTGRKHSECFYKVQSLCKKCNKKLYQLWYSKHREYKCAYQQLKRDNNTEFLKSLKKDVKTLTPEQRLKRLFN